MMNIKFVDLLRQYHEIKAEIDEAMEQVIATTAFVGNANNPFVRSFENNFAKFTGARHCIACGNGTDALEILLKAMGIGPGDEVLVPAISWIATSEAVSNVGAKPVFVDIEAGTYCLNPDLIDEKITKNTKAIIPVHLYGHPADMPAIMKKAQKYNLKVLEDCAQAHGAEIGGKRVGTFGNAAAFSFYPGKNLGAWGDAGGMVTDNDEIATIARMISRHGQSGKKHVHLMEGRNSRMDGLQAAILDVKLKHLDMWTDARISIAGRYSKLLQEEPVTLPVTLPNYRHVFHLFVIRTKHRNDLMAFLKERGIPTAIQYPTALPFLDAYKHYGHKKADFPVAAEMQDKIMSLPLFPEMKDEEINYVAEGVKAFFSKTGS